MKLSPKELRYLKNILCKLLLLKNKKFMIVVIVIAVFTMIGIGSSYIWQDDNLVEESVESIIEEVMAKELELDPGCLDGRIDLTPSSREN